MNIFRGHDNHFEAHIGRGIGLFLVSCFLMSAVALATPLYDNCFLLKECSICKAKTSFFGTRNKIKADIPLSAAIDDHASWEVYPTLWRIQCDHQAPFIASLLPNPFLNKAPPSLC